MRGDRHGRTARSDSDVLRRPADGYRVRDRRRFAQLVEEVLPTLPGPLLAAVADAEVQVEDVPQAPAVGFTDEVPLAAFSTAVRGRRARLVVYRRPLEARAASRPDLLDLLRSAVGMEVATALGLEEQYGDEFDDGWDG